MTTTRRSAGAVTTAACVAVLWLLVPSQRAQAQFTKITDPANAVVNDQFESGGGAWIDVNGDGFLDLFVANGNLSSQNNSLYMNDQNGGFVKVTTGAIVTDGGSSIGSTWGDFNNDGAIDCFVTNRQNFGNFLYLGNGDSTFTPVVAGNVVTDIANSNSGSWIDADRDGNLDLYVVNFQGNDFYYHNNGPPIYDFTRIDTLPQVGDGGNFSISGSWADMNDDSLPDLFVGNAGTQNDNLYKNDGANEFSLSVLADGRASVGSSWGDYDNDGAPDLFVANTLGQNNVLYHNGSSPGYALSALGVGVVSNDGGSSVGSAWGDYDNDGDLDLFVANDGGNNFLYDNSGPPGYTFTKVTTGSAVNDGGNSFGAVWGDYDRDGWLDLFVANRLNQKNFLYHNDGGSNHWLTLRLAGTASNRSAIGAKVRLKATINGTAVWQHREIASQNGYNSQNLEAHFGLGDAAAADSALIEWPSGLTEQFLQIRPDRTMMLAEGVPPAPTGVSVTAGNGELRVRWERSPIGNFSQYRILADTTPGPLTEVGTTSAAEDTGFTIGGLTNGVTYYVRVRVMNSGSVESPSSEEVHAAPLPVMTQSVAVNSKWNIVALPLSPVDGAAATLFPTASSAAFSFAGVSGYQTADTLAPGSGYWVKFPSAGEMPVTGFALESDTIAVGQGWNMIGCLSAPLAAQSIVTDPPAIVTSAFYSYDQGYVASDTIRPGHGYWVKASEAGSFILSPGAASGAAGRVLIRPTSEMPPPPPSERTTASAVLPNGAALLQNYPNPFNPSTSIGFTVERPGFVRLRVFDILGRVAAVLVWGELPPGGHSARFDAGSLSGGVYYYTLEADGIVISRKMLLSK